MGLFDKFKKKEIILDARFYKKMSESDLPEYREAEIKENKGADLLFGKKPPKLEEDPFNYFRINLMAIGTTISSKDSWEKCGYTESEIKSIFGDSEIVVGAHPDRGIKDIIWNYVFQMEDARQLNELGKSKDGILVEKYMKIFRETTKWLDWDKALEEFWIDESKKDYRGYIILDNRD